MKKILLLLAVMPFLFTSCFVTRYASNEAELRRDYVGAYVDDIETVFGEPHEVRDLQRGYVYTYNQQGRVWKSKKMVDQYMKFSFNENDEVRSIQSTTTRRTKRFSAWRTFGLPFTILGGVVVAGTVATVVAAEKSGGL